MTRKQTKAKRFEQLTQLALSRILGVSDRSIRLWEREGIPRNADGSYSLREVLAWMGQRYERRILDMLESRYGCGETVAFLLDKQLERVQ